MRKESQLSLLAAFLILGVGYMFKTIVGSEIPYLTEILWASFLLLCALAVFIDRVFLIDFLSMKTTKNGLNMGMIFLLLLVLVVVVNYIGFKNNKKWDLTSEGINSLSDQTTQILKTLDKDVQLIGFFDANSADAKNIFLDITEKMKFDTDRIKVEIFEPTKRPDLVKQYNIAASGDIVVQYEGKQKIISSLTFVNPQEAEQNLINEIYKLKQSESKVIYFTTGKGELLLDSPTQQIDPNSSSKLKEALRDVGYDVKELNLSIAGKVPDDAAIVLILRPKFPYQQKEVEALKSFSKRGGNLFIAVDPGERHGINNILSHYGVDFKGNYIFDISTGANYVAYGLSYPAKKVVGKSSNINTVYVLASEVGFKNINGINHEVLVETSKQSFVTNEIVKDFGSLRGPNLQAFSVGVLAEGKLSESDKDFKTMVFGDSDFLNDDLFERSPGNRDFVLNSIAYLTNQGELISVRPKNLALNPFILTPTVVKIFLFGVIIPIPMLLLILSGVLWYRRRHA